MQLELWHILLLAVVQGIAEFLPISSSGHVVIVAALLSPSDADAFNVIDLNIVLHIGTLLSIVVFYWRRIVQLLTDDRRTIGLLIVGTIPGALIGLGVELTVAEMLSSPLLAGGLLIVTGLMLIWVSRRPTGNVPYQSLSFGKAIAIGGSQALAILPGLSRSGATICTGLSVGLAPESAATFSFLLAIPIIAGGGAVHVAKMAVSDVPLSTPVWQLLIGGALSFVVGLAALWWLVRSLERGHLQRFAWWCVPVGIAVVVWQLSRLIG